MKDIKVYEDPYGGIALIAKDGKVINVQRDGCILEEGVWVMFAVSYDNEAVKRGYVEMLNGGPSNGLSKAKVGCIRSISYNKYIDDVVINIEVGECVKDDRGLYNFYVTCYRFYMSKDIFISRADLKHRG